MAAFTVDPTKFHGEGAVVNWDVVSRRLGDPLANGSLGTFVELRWVLSADMGLPTEPSSCLHRPKFPIFDKPAER